MKLELSEIVNSRQQIDQLLATKMKINPSFWLARQARKLREVLATFDQHNNDLIRELGREVRPGVFQIGPGDDSWAEYQRRLNELGDEAIEIGLEPRPVAFLGDIEVAPEVLVRLHFLFTEGGEAEA